MTIPYALPDLVEDPPGGANLELDAQFGEMERAAQGKAESQFGSAVEAAEPPDWKEARRLALELCERTRDLRVLTMLAVSTLHLEGLPGFTSVVSAIRQQVEGNWEAVHPQLDPEDDNDPMQRANALLSLQHRLRVLRPIRELPLASTPRTGAVTWQDIAVMRGYAEPEPGREKMSEAAVRAAFAGTDKDRLAAVRDSTATLLEDLKAIPAAFDQFATYGSGPDFAELQKLVGEMRAELLRYEQLVAEDAEDAAEEAAPAGDGEAETGERVAAPRAGGRGFASIQAIAALNSRDDALHALELAAAFFRSNEPSSPLPLLIDRAKRLSSLPFLEILRDMAPDGLQQAEVVVGPQERREE
jgi:type VI secretion system protein ImpA